jgi:hypothetical protein
MTSGPKKHHQLQGKGETVIAKLPFGKKKMIKAKK